MTAAAAVKSFPWGTMLLVGASIGVAYVVIKRPALTEPWIKKVQGWVGMSEGVAGQKSPDTSEGLDAGTGVVKDAGPDASIADNYDPSLGATGLDDAGPEGPPPEVWSRAKWYLVNEPRLNS